MASWLRIETKDDNLKKTNTFIKNLNQQAVRDQQWQRIDEVARAIVNTSNNQYVDAVVISEISMSEELS